MLYYLDSIGFMLQTINIRITIRKYNDLSVKLYIR